MALLAMARHHPGQPASRAAYVRFRDAVKYVALHLWSVRPGALCISALLLAHLLLAIDAARRLTVTHDEYWHMPAGLAAWKLGRFDLDNLNPPLTRAWDTLPLLCTSARADPTLPAGDPFQLGDQFLSNNRDHYERLLMLARSMNVLFSVAAGLLLAVWANELFGMRSACLAAALWSFCPTVLAHAALVTPDMGTTCLFVATLFACWRFSRRPTWRGASIVGVLLGLAQLAKFTSCCFTRCAQRRGPSAAPETRKSCPSPGEKPWGFGP